MQIATEITAFTCICCPIGCLLEVSFDTQRNIASIEGNVCKRGLDYAEREAIAPERMVTAVLPVSGCLEPVSVKTSAPIPKAQMTEVLEACVHVVLSAPVCAGQMILSNVCNTGVDVVATKSVP